MPENIVTYGLEQVHIAFKDLVNVAQPAWETPIAIPGAVGWKPKAEGKASTFYADNGAYYISTSNSGYTGDLEMALVPDVVLAEMLGWYIDTNGMLIEVADGIPKPFALLGQVSGDQKNRRFAYFDCTASRPAKENKTNNDAIEPATDVLSLVVKPIEIIGKKVVKGNLELSATNALVYNAFFTEVTLPTAAGA